MATIGRNEPCPCGSGKKYKRCCLPIVEAARLPAPEPPPLPPSAHDGLWAIEDDGLDDLSNSVLDLVKARRFDEAMSACRCLLEDFPDVVDGFERTGFVFAAMGNHARAVYFYRLAVDFVTHPDRIEGYDPENIEDYKEQLRIQERLAGLR